MRNRNLILILTVLVAAAFVAGCGGTRQLTKAENDQIGAIGGKIAKGEGLDGKACAPKELAVAQAELEHARFEATQNWEDAKGYITKADKSADAFLAKVQDCEDKKKVPACGFVAEPGTIAPGKCAMLKWKGENVTKMYFGPEDPKAPDAAMSGTKEVCPKDTTEYQMTCIGKGGTNYEFATVKVEVPPPPPPPVVAPVPVPVPVAKPAEKMALRVNFDTGKSTIRPADLAELQKGVEFIKKNPGAKLNIVGYTDSRGKEKYNQKLSEQRANAVKKYLEGEVEIPADKIAAMGKGAADPVGDNKTKEGQFLNRRVEIQIVGK